MRIIKPLITLIFKGIFWKPKTPLLDVIYKNSPDLLEQVKQLVSEGANPNERTKYFETPLRVASRFGRFDVVRFLFNAGADPKHLEWTPLFHAIADGSIEDIKKCLSEGNSLNARDTWERTPFLLAVQRGDIEKTQLLLELGANLDDRGRADMPAIEHAIQMDNAVMLTWLIKQGVSFETYNQYGHTPLMEAAENGAIKCVQSLLSHGADISKKDRSQFSQKSAVAHASTLEIAEILLAAGANFSDLENDIRAQLLQIGQKETFNISKQEYQAQKIREFGIANPEMCDKSFWYEMVRCNATAWKARSHFDDTDDYEDAPIWSYERFGMSITPIGNGEFIEIAGEHEDYYDPDFCIYNDVFHHKGGGVFSIYQYPKNIFPPTDFHTATLVNCHIYIIGNLGYPSDRLVGATPIFRLNVKTFVIERIEATGDNPGWIYKHSAKLIAPSIIQIQDGDVFDLKDGETRGRLNTSTFELNLESFSWKKLERFSDKESFSYVPEEYKRFCHPDRNLLSVKDGDQWRLLKIIIVDRIDIAAGQTIRISDKNITAKQDDFIFVVAYSVSKPFRTIEKLELSLKNTDWEIEHPCKVVSTPSFPQEARYKGARDVSKIELQEFNRWKELFERGDIEIL